jgi:hypothetical protein
MTGDRVALIDWDESHVDVPDLDLALPHNAAGLDEDTYDIAAQARAAWEAAVCWDPAGPTSLRSSGSPRFARSEQQRIDRARVDLRHCRTLARRQRAESEVLHGRSRRPA